MNNGKGLQSFREFTLILLPQFFNAILMQFEAMNKAFPIS